MENSHSAAYAAAGVDIEAGYAGVQLMKRHVARTTIPGVVSGIGGFGGLFAPELSGMKEPVLVAGMKKPVLVSGIGGFGGLFAPELSGMKEPVLVSGTDGVGTKLRLAQLLDRHDTIVIDCHRLRPHGSGGCDPGPALQRLSLQRLLPGPQGL